MWLTGFSQSPSELEPQVFDSWFFRLICSINPMHVWNPPKECMLGKSALELFNYRSSIYNGHRASGLLVASSRDVYVVLVSSLVAGIKTRQEEWARDRGRKCWWWGRHSYLIEILSPLVSNKEVHFVYILPLSWYCLSQFIALRLALQVAACCPFSTIPHLL